MFASYRTTNHDINDMTTSYYNRQNKDSHADLRCTRTPASPLTQKPFALGLQQLAGAVGAADKAGLIRCSWQCRIQTPIWGGGGSKNSLKKKVQRDSFNSSPGWTFRSLFGRITCWKTDGALGRVRRWYIGCWYPLWHVSEFSLVHLKEEIIQVLSGVICFVYWSDILWRPRWAPGNQKTERKLV